MSRTNRAPWTPAEDEIIAAYYPQYGTAECARRLPGRTRMAIYLRATRSGVEFAGSIGRPRKVTPDPIVDQKRKYDRTAEPWSPPERYSDVFSYAQGKRFAPEHA